MTHYTSSTSLSPAALPPPSTHDTLHIFNISQSCCTPSRPNPSRPNPSRPNPSRPTPVYELATGLHSSSTPTPSKKATAALANISLDSPTKPSDDEDTLPVLIDDRKRSVLLDSQDTEDKFEELRKKFVGEIDLPECEEPLLKESKRRFVLFPIQYHEGC
ncbi:hypothetical protein BDR05DRAFT_1013939 [Suillus weaverae]|nr:hypothetical protein BDR05DRAFT_1013939 [Suillus weaverae]